MSNLFREHPIISLLIVAELCETAIIITRLLTHQTVVRKPIVEVNVESKKDTGI